MKFEKILKEIAGTVRTITRDEWPYFLVFDIRGFLMLKDHKGELSPYVISEYDFDYEWEIFS